LIDHPADSLSETWHDKADERNGLRTPEVNAALAICKETTNRGPNLPGRGKIDNGCRSREPINGLSTERSNLIRHIVGLRYSGYSYREAFQDAAQSYELKPHTAENYYYKHRDAVDFAEQEHLENALKSYHNHLWAIRSMMSDAGPRAVKTLIGVMDDKKSSPNIRLKAAAYILKMINVDGSANASPSEHAAVEGLKLIKDLRTEIKDEKDSHIVDAVAADDAEIVGDDESEDRPTVAV
jgi:hypothetical protein